VEVCGQGPALVRPASAILACADHGTIAEHLHWSSWTATQATATGTVTWRACFAQCASSDGWDSTTADLTLTDPVPEPGKGNLFARLDMHVTGPTPPGFMRNVVFSETPAPTVARPSASVPATPPSSRPPAVSAAPSGTLGYAQIEGFWVDAGGPSGLDGSYTYPQIAAAITYCESSFEPGAIQPGEPYSTTGWGLWQITPGNSVSHYGTDFQVLDPWNNAEEAVYKYNAAGGFSPWTTYLNGCYASHLQTTSADTELTDPGEYVQVGSAPPGTPSSPPPDPGSKYGPPMPGTAPVAYAFWKGTNGDLYEAQGPADASLSGPTNLGYKTLGSAPAAGVDSNGHTYVYWEGTDGDLWEAYWNGRWLGPYNRHMGTLGSAPTVAVTGNGTAYVFWKGTNGNLYEAQGPADGSLSGPTNLGYKTLGSAPAAGVDSNGHTYVYWEGTDGDLWEAYWNGRWLGPYNRHMGTLGSAPTVAVSG
jgi:Transglycosylase SLT domain